MPFTPQTLLLRQRNRGERLVFAPTRQLFMCEKWWPFAAAPGDYFLPTDREYIEIEKLKGSLPEANGGASRVPASWPLVKQTRSRWRCGVVLIGEHISGDTSHLAKRVPRRTIHEASTRSQIGTTTAGQKQP